MIRIFRFTAIFWEVFKKKILQHLFVSWTCQ